MSPRGISLIYLGLLWSWTASACWRDWTGSSDYRYGLLVLPLAFYFAFKRLGSTPADSPGNFRLPAMLALFLPVVFGLPLELLNQSPLHWRPVAWVIFGNAAIGTLGLVYLIGGKAWLRASRFPLLFAATAIPWPTFLEQMAGATLLPWLTETTGDLLRLGGIPVQRQGFLLILPHCVVGIEQACSGLRSLQGALMVSLAAGEITRLSFARRCGLLILAPFIALGINLARTLALSLAGFRGGNEAIHQWHDASGFTAMFATTLILFGFAALIRHQTTSTSPAIPPVRNPDFSAVPRWLPWGFLLALGGAHLWYAWHGWNHSASEPELALRDHSWTPLPLPADLAAMLHPDKGGYFRETNPDYGALTGYHFFWKSSRETVDQLYHRPDICMPGAGWQLIGTPTPFTSTLYGHPWQWHLLEYERNGIRATMLWGGWLNGAAAEFSLGRSSSLQMQIMRQLVQSGTRNVSYEVAAVLVPFTGNSLTPPEAAKIVEQIFTLNENPARR